MRFTYVYVGPRRCAHYHLETGDTVASATAFIANLTIVSADRAIVFLCGPRAEVQELARDFLAAAFWNAVAVWSDERDAFVVTHRTAKSDFAIGQLVSVSERPVAAATAN